jgi:hypothetical protein
MGEHGGEADEPGVAIDRSRPHRRDLLSPQAFAHKSRARSTAAHTPTVGKPEPAGSFNRSFRYVTMSALH